MSRAPIDPAWRLHVFGKIVPMDDVCDLDRARREIGEPGAATGTLVVCCGISSLFVLLVVAFAILS